MLLLPLAFTYGWEDNDGEPDARVHVVETSEQNVHPDTTTSKTKPLGISTS